MSKLALTVLLSLILLFIVGIYFFISLNNTSNGLGPPRNVNVLGKQKVKYPQDYTILMIGDSMTETLGNSDEIKQYLSEYYPKKTFEVLNYGYGATNILSVMERITKETERGRKFRPIEEIDYDLVLVESFGQNPLSEYKLDEGLKRQTEELERIVQRLKETNPKGKIIFVATISPNSVIFAKNQVDLTPEKRVEWVKERVAYIKNHISFANSHNIPLINIFEKSLLESGDGNPVYISKSDFIHPSPGGTIFISHNIADFIYQNNIFPH